MKWLFALTIVSMLVGGCDTSTAVPFEADPNSLDLPDGSTSLVDEGFPQPDLAHAIPPSRPDLGYGFPPPPDFGFGFPPPPDFGFPPPPNFDFGFPPPLSDLGVPLSPPDLSSLPDLAPPVDLEGTDLAMNVCRAGVYEGTWSGKAMNFNLSGNIAFTLAPPVNQVLTVTSGTFSGTGALGSTITATVEGALNCASLTFTGTLANGTISVLNTKIPWTGDLGATYLLATQAFQNGTWTMQSAQGAQFSITGNGAWSAK